MNAWGQNIEPIGRSHSAGEHWDTCVQTEKVFFFSSASPYEEHLAARFKCRVAQLEVYSLLRANVNVSTLNTWHRFLFLLKQTTHVGRSQSLGQEWENAVNQWSRLVDRWATFPWLNTQRVGDTQSCSSLISRPLLTSCLFCHLSILYTSSFSSKSKNRRCLTHGPVPLLLQ